MNPRDLISNALRRPKPPKGLAALHPLRRTEIARQGGHALFAKRGSRHMARIGRRGGKAGAKP